MGRAALHVAVRHWHHFLCVLLCVDRFQSQRSGRQYAEVWRLHSGDSSGQAHGGLYQRSFDPDHAGGRTVPDHYLVYSRVDDCRHSPQPSAVLAGRNAIRAASGMDDERARREFLFWRNVVADRGGRGHGYGDTDRGAVNHAPLRWIYAAQRAHSRPPQLVVGENAFLRRVTPQDVLGLLHLDGLMEGSSGTLFGRLWPTRWRRKPHVT